MNFLLRNMLRGQQLLLTFILVTLLLAIPFAGCNSNQEKSKSRPEDVAGSSETDAHPIVLVLLTDSKSSSRTSSASVVKDESSGIAKRIQKEFKSLEVGEVTIVRISFKDFFQHETPDPNQKNDISEPEKNDRKKAKSLLSRADLIIYPPQHFGDLIARKKIRAIPNYVVESESYRASDVLRHQRRLLGYHDKTPFAVSMGTSSFMLMCRRDLFDIHGLKIPTTWADYERACKQLAELQAAGDLQTPKNWSPAIEPLKGNWKSATMIARSASYVRAAGRYSCLFSYSKSQPLIETEPYQKSLIELKTVFDLMHEQHRNLDPLEVESAFLNGECAMAITWPHPGVAVDDDEDSIQVVSDAKLLELPGSKSNFGFTDRKWGESDSLQTQIPTLGVDGLCCSILSTTKQSGVAARRLGLIVGKDLSASICYEDKVNGFPNRASQLGESQNWISPRYPETFAEEFADLVESQNQSSVWMIRPRFEKAWQFESILSNSINECLNGKTAADVLTQAATQISELEIEPELLKKLTLEGFGVEK